jgi:pilus assembly protein Flp/PilA
MRGLRNILSRFLANESGATATEYALIVTGIAIAIIASLNAITGAINQTFSNITTALQ